MLHADHLRHTYNTKTKRQMSTGTQQSNGFIHYEMCKVNISNALMQVLRESKYGILWNSVISELKYVSIY